MRRLRNMHDCSVLCYLSRRWFLDCRANLHNRYKPIEAEDSPTARDACDLIKLENNWRGKQKFDRIGTRMATCWLNEARMFKRMGNYQRALHCMNQALSLDPRLLGGYSTRAELWALQGYYEHALRDCDTSRTQSTDNYLTELTAAKALYHLGEFERCVATATIAIEKCHVDANCFAVRARGYQGLGDYKSAAVDSTTALALNHQSIEIHSISAFSNYVIGEYDQSLKAYTAMIEQFRVQEPYTAWAYAGRADVHSAQGNYRQAIEDATRCLELGPCEEHQVWARLTRAEGLRRTKDFDKALADLDFVIETGKRIQHALFLKGTIYSAMGNSEEATELYNSALQHGELTTRQRARAMGETIFQTAVANAIDEANENSVGAED